MTDYKGTIIEESLKNKEVLKKMVIVKTKVEKVTDSHKTPWLNQWTTHNVTVPENVSDDFFDELSKSLDDSHEWYVELENNKYNVLVFHDRVIKKRVFKYNF